ncbi:DsbA family oxidoreductase [Halioglobus maricola]|uniref:DsbA family oxidoreductase n=1 Tax=Halioglobus maricola TaxID=2601894 RepID=A0A5P9NM60_9GAMM|nr:DsbA family oxidoreductase [Halioglobus maricola]QFU76842.1 DsbA family oxidoreductase [Halioglobus maricola]
MKKLSIDIVSDVMCPWCIIGYKGLEIAMADLAPDIEADINWLPFEINPHYEKEGKNFIKHLTEKYPSIPVEQFVQQRNMIAAKGREVGFEFSFSDESRIFNSFDLHRLLAWAKEQGKQHSLSIAFFQAHFSECMPLYDQATVLSIVRAVGLDSTEAAKVLTSDAYSDQVRKEQQRSASMGIHSVPTFFISGKNVASGGQPVEVFKNLLREAASESPYCD